MYCLTVLPDGTAWLYCLTVLQTKGLMEQVLVDNMIGFMQERRQDKQPFMVYYAPYAIHTM
jgi:hypothetical protein